MYHIDRACDEQLRGPFAFKRKIENIYQVMLDDWLPQGPHINDGKFYGGKRIRGPHRRAAKRKKAQSMDPKATCKK